MKQEGDVWVECPSCRNDSHTAVVRVEHIYPDLFLGLPTFWRFMSPALARSVTGVIGVLSVALPLLSLASLSLGSAVMSLSVGLVTVLSVYIFVACVRALGRHRVKEQFRCSKCGLEWSRANERRD
jgi:hypothetical protein